MNIEARVYQCKEAQELDTEYDMTNYADAGGKQTCASYDDTLEIATSFRVSQKLMSTNFNPKQYWEIQ